MATNMAFTWNMEQHVWEFANGTKIVKLTPAEVSFIDHALERNHWENEIDLEIDSNEDSLDFDEMPRDELLDLCMEELEDKWESGNLDNDPDYQSIVFEVAEDNGIWRD